MMAVTSAGFRWVATILLVSSSALLGVTPARAQTAQELQIFRSLSPDQQRQVLDQLGKQNGQVTSTGQPLQFPATSVPKTNFDTAQPQVPQEPTFRAGDSLILSVQVVPVPDGAPDRSPDVARALAELQQQMLDGNPYTLDRAGELRLPGAPPITLAGLTDVQAEQRLNTEPTLQGLAINLSMLPVEKTLKPFGYDLFSNVPTTFAPATDVPVPADYVVGPGDSLQVQLIGDNGGSYSLTVGRDGTVDFPQLGPVAVAGLRFTAVQEMLERRVKEQMIGMRASVSMGALRSIQVYVLGEAARPGSYTVSGLSTITNALFASGGVTPIGSLRDIQLKRDGKVVRHLDLYDLLLNGDTSGDTRLLPGDVIFIPPVGMTVAVTGEVQRPAIYEVKPGAVASDILYLSGGLTPDADPRTATLERIDQRRSRTVIDLDLTTPQGRATRLQSGDEIRIQGIRDSLDGAVTLEGHVYHPGSVQYRAGMRLTDLIGSLDELKPLSDTHYVLVRRESGAARIVSVVSADLAAALANPASPSNIPLQARDRVHVFDLATSRDRVVAPILQDLARQSEHGSPTQVVGVGGQVKVPGQYPLEPGMTVRDLVRAGGSLDQAAYGGEAELIRYDVVNGEKRQTALLKIDLAKALAGDSAANVPLQSFDYLVVKEMPEWRDQETVRIEGEVRFPGTYPIRRGETLKSVIERAGGLTDLAFVQGSVFTRKDLQQREQQRLQVLADRLQRELAAVSLEQAQSKEAANTAQTIAAGQGLLSDLKATKAVGRLVINLPGLLAAPAGSDADVVLKGGDRLVIPRKTQEVTVMGEVQNATSLLYQAGLGRDDYIDLAGGTTQRADAKRTYVIRADGSVVARSRGWFSSNSAASIRPGDTIIVPLDAQKIRPLTLWTSVTQIMYNIAVAVAAVHAL